MKLLILTSIDAYKKEVQEILKEGGVIQYSYNDVQGHAAIKSVADKGNWFVGDRYESESVLFFAFVSDATVDNVFDRVVQFNKELETESKIHISIVNIEKSN